MSNSEARGSLSSTSKQDHVTDIALASQSLMASELKHKASVYPVQDSPNVNSARALDDKSSASVSTKRKRDHTRSMGSKKLKKNKENVNPSKWMLLLLREPQTSNCMIACDASEKAWSPSTNNNTKSLINSWNLNYPFSCIHSAH